MCLAEEGRRLNLLVCLNVFRVIERSSGVRVISFPFADIFAELHGRWVNKGLNQETKREGVDLPLS